MVTHGSHRLAGGEVAPRPRLGRSFAAAASAIALFAFGPSAMAASVAAFSGGFELSQVIAPVGSSAIFGFDLSLAGLPGASSSGAVSSFGYLNVLSGGGAWLVQNQPIPLSSLTADEHNNVWFTDFTGISGGANLALSAIVNDTPFLSMPTSDATWTSGSVLTGTVANAFGDYGGESGPPTPVAPPVAPPPPPDVAKIEGYLRGGVADIKQYWNECGPTATANSLIWLAQKHGFSDKLPRKPDGSIDQQALVLMLAQTMKPGFAPDNSLPDKQGYSDRGYAGLARGELETGKLKFISDNGLPLVVEGGSTDANAQGANTFGFVKNELSKGQDVEFLIQWPNDGYHWVTVVGQIDAGKDNKTLIVHDPLFGNGNHYWRMKDDGTLTSPVGIASRAVAESMVPEPSAWLLIIFGFGALGGVLRRSRTAQAA